jgi:hypothetical protein
MYTPPETGFFSNGDVAVIVPIFELSGQATGSLDFSFN